MADRPLGLEPMYEREFNVIGYVSEPLSRRDRLREWWYRTWNFSFGRGSTLDVELDDEMIDFLKRVGWINRLGDGYYLTHKGSDYLVKVCRSEIARLETEKDD